LRRGPLKLFSGSRSLQPADGARYRNNGLVTLGLDHFAGRVEDAQFDALFLRQESREMNSRPWFILSKDHGFQQWSAAELETILNKAQFKRVHFSIPAALLASGDRSFQ
jgi:hypothetical protein